MAAIKHNRHRKENLNKEKEMKKERNKNQGRKEPTSCWLYLSAFTCTRAPPAADILNSANNRSVFSFSFPFLFESPPICRDSIVGQCHVRNLTPSFDWLIDVNWKRGRRREPLPRHRDGADTQRQLGTHLDRLIPSSVDLSMFRSSSRQFLLTNDVLLLSFFSYFLLPSN